MRREHAQIALIAVLLIVVTALVYARVGQFGFVDYDDDAFVTANAHVQQGLTIPSVQWAFGSIVAANWHPITMLSHELDVELFGVHAGPAHLVNLALHIANSLLLLILLRKLTGSIWAGGLAAALFALHPLHVESVAWISERKDVLSTFFFLLTLLAYARYANRREWRWYAAAMVLLALGLMSKPMLVTTPLVMLALDDWPLKRPVRWPRLIIEKIPFAVLAAADAAATFLLQRHTGAVSSLAKIPPPLRIENAIVSYIHYLADMAWPARLAVFYPYPAHLSPVLVGACALALILITFLAWRARSRFPWLWTGWLWYLITLLPVIGLVQVGDQARADRYTYIPSIGIFIALAWSLKALAGSKPKRCIYAAACIVALGLLAWRTWAQVGAWQNSRTLWTHTDEVTRDNWLAWNHLATLDEKDHRYEDAITLARRVIAVRPSFAGGYFNLGNILLETNDANGAIDAFMQALRLRPNFAAAHNNLARTLMMIGQIEPAIAHFQQAVADEPDNPLWRQNLETALRYRQSATSQPSQRQ